MKLKNIFSAIFDTSARFASSVRRINERLQRLAQKLGTDSRVYQDAASKLDTMLPSKNLYYNKNNVLQIGKPAQLYKDASIHNTINQFDKGQIPTWGEVKEKFEQDYEEYKEYSSYFEGKSREVLPIEDYINIQTSISDLIYDLSKDRQNDEMSENEQKALEILQTDRQGKITYNELSQVRNLLRTNTI